MHSFFPSFARRLPAGTLVLAAAALAGCASSTSVVTGARHPALPGSAVRVYADMPPHSGVIGLVRSRSVLALGEQGHLDAAVSALREEAGRLGANGVVIARTEDRPIAIVGGGGKSGALGIPVETPHLEGRAIYVSAN